MEVVARGRRGPAGLVGALGAWLLACGPSSTTPVGGGGAGGAPAVGQRAQALTAATPGLQTPRAGHTVTPMRDGRLLVAGGESLGLLEVYDPLTGRSLQAPPLGGPRSGHRAVALPSGQVLLLGGQTPDGAAVLTVERYTPASGASGEVTEVHGALLTGRQQPGVALLASGQIVVVGGQAAGAPAIELLDPGQGTSQAPAVTWAGGVVPELTGTQAWLRGDGKVWFHGRVATAQPGQKVQRFFAYDPATQAVAAHAPSNDQETALEVTGPAAVLTPGDTLVLTGGTVTSTKPAAPSSQVTWSLPDSSFAQMALGQPQRDHTATGLPSGQLLLVGVTTSVGSSPCVTQVADLDVRTSSTLDDLPAGLRQHTTTVLAWGQALTLGGRETSSDDPASELVTNNAHVTEELPPLAFSGAPGSADAVAGAAVTALMGGELLVTGGPGAGVGWRLGPTGAVLGTSAAVARFDHTATLLGDGRVLVVGGDDGAGGSLASAELYDPATHTFVATGSLLRGRRRHAATLLPSGEVLITGGVDAGGAAVAEVERFTPAAAASEGAFSIVGKLHIPRWDHGSTLLTDGTVWVSGGVVAEAKPAVTTERLVQGLGEGVVDTPVTVPGRAAAVALATGEALVAGDGVALVRGQDGVMTPLSGAPAGRVDLVPTPSGHVMLCGDQVCARFDPRSRRIGTARPLAPLVKAGCVLRSRAVVCAARPGDTAASVVTIEPAVRPGWQPTLTGVPTELAPGELTTLTGKRLTGPLTGALAAAAPAPQVLLLPLAGGPPRAGRVSSWTETSVTFVDPTTPFHGPTLVYVSQGGVLSEAQATVVRSSPKGTACEVDGECASGFCTDGVCCDLRCRGNCEACRAVHQEGGVDGVCGPIRAGADPRDTCDPDPPASCGRTGVCDGHRQCARYADGISCGDLDNPGTCQSGACVTGARCQGNDLVDPGGAVLQSCAPYLCEDDHCAGSCDPTLGDSCASGYSCTSQGLCRTCSADGRGVVVDATTTLPCHSYKCSQGECLEQCAENADCETGYRCTGGVCAIYCEGNASSLGSPGRPCTPYQCIDGRCPRFCESNLECAPGNVCSLDRTCVPTPVSSSTSSSCAATRGPLPGSPAPALLALLALVATARRRRVRPRVSLVVLLLSSRAGAQATAPSAAPAAGPDAATSVDSLRRAKDEFRRGVALFEAGDYEAALEAFASSREAYPSKQNTLNVALTLQKLGRVDEALDLYEEAITRFASELSAADRASVPATVAGLRAQLGELTVTATVDGMVLVDGRARGRLPLARPLRLVAGSHRVRVLKDGYEPAEATVRTEAGSSTTLDLRPAPLRSVGRLRVEASARGSVVIDGATVGELPWEGSLLPGSHLVTIEGEREGSAPARVTVLEGQITLLRPRLVPLGPVVSLDAEPAQAELRLDGVPLGRGHWQGRLPLGAFRLEAREEGYEPAVQALVVDAQPQHVALRLAIDPRHPRWPRRLPGVFTATAAVGYALGPSLRGGADATCASSCSSRGLVNGPLLTLRLGYELPSGLAFELSGGYLSLHQSLTRTFDARFPRSSRDYAVHYRLDETPELSGPWVGAGASLHVALGPVALRTRMLLGLARLGGRAPLSGQASTDAGASDVIIPESAASASSTPLLVQTEVGIERRLGPWNLGGSLGLLVVTTGGSDFERRSLVVPPSCSSSDPGAIGCAPVTRLPGPDRTHGPFAVLVPQLTLQRAFD